MKPLGTQIIAEFIHCSKKILNDKKALEQALRLGIEKYDLKLKSINSHQFDPIGITAIAIIGESHIAIHTYPEAGHASLDIFTCVSDSRLPNKLLNFFKNKFKPKTVRAVELLRGNPLEIKQKNWITSFSSGKAGFSYYIKKNLFSKKSKYQQIDIIENEQFGRMLFLDKDLQISEGDAHIYNASLIFPFKKEKKKLNKVAILGGGDGGVLSELLKFNPKNVFLIDIDKEVIAASKKFLQCICKDAFNKPNVKVVIDDANKFLETNNDFDAIIYDLTMHPESLIRTDRATFLNQVFLRIKNSLNKKGIVSLQCCSEFDTETLKLLKRMMPKYFKNINLRGYFIPSFCENWIFASAKVK